MRAAPQLLSLALTASASAAAASANDGGSAGSAAPNHVIFFLVDDYGFADASFKSALYPTKGLNPPPTPTFDSLARAGVMLSVLLPRPARAGCAALLSAQRRLVAMIPARSQCQPREASSTTVAIAGHVELQPVACRHQAH